mmetsp:Transcript_8455/g.21628  ORF Transcript_8455/g.21628 Transcript_8455/m.21628 type:complete len:398 (-) Transcript_8455:137-1330(-)|eukprot:CAMPEP_0182925664 /NCGR_PEP_ID=MMETSP0105_2-20130417/9975_1 /TAXON_ID=81532 ORGANISM="Acanthoeca-like sp., Strain 10tr" /NCGR_SAMPLE_ID=MMETSP0105_2 /ASSEMBLY_ACC=CAM_ASM_000205 /LENGTH=397 /DNA_ID=CAMNT_0025063523 /DNA_START=114 /DNA_END=1307 /DNA_ORIENTATION=+
MAVPSIAAVLPVLSVLGHGTVNVPASNRHGGSLKLGGSCDKGECVWFTNEIKIPGWPTLPDEFRTVLRNVTNGSKHDYFFKSPWRAPGTAPVLGHGCGVGAGGPQVYGNGDRSQGIPQGADGIDLPAQTPVVWHPGDEVEVAFGMNANHGGGYSWRLCKIDNESSIGVNGVTEECFLNNTLEYVGDTGWIVYPDDKKPRVPYKRTTVTEGTHPPGSTWVVNPVPTCYYCDYLDTCGPQVEPHPMIPGNYTIVSFIECFDICKFMNRSKLEKAGCSYPQNAHNPPTLQCQLEEFRTCGFCEGQDIDYEFMDQVICSAYCSGQVFEACIPGTEAFPPPGPNISGAGQSDLVPAWEWSVMDLVKIPDNLDAGDYLLSWRWDTEETSQVWQNCADVRIVAK